MKYLELNTNLRSSSTIEVLPFLKGREIDKVVMGYLHALRPSLIEVIPHRSGHHLDSRRWRVRIFLDANNRIEEIKQEVEVGLYEGVENGFDLHYELEGKPNPFKGKDHICILDAKAVAKIQIV